MGAGKNNDRIRLNLSGRTIMQMLALKFVRNFVYHDYRDCKNRIY